MKDSLRISVTQECNLNCPYCHREGQIESKEEMPLDKIKEIAKASQEASIKKVKITGGEPLLRKDIVDVVKAFSGFEDISMVTNGLLLKYFAKPLKDAGLKRINIGCDSLTSSQLKNEQAILEGLEAARDAGISPIKLNMVVLKGINDHEISGMIDFARKNRVILQLIELINTDNRYFKKRFYDLSKVEKKLDEDSFLVTKREMHNRMQFNLGDVIVEIVRPFHNNFCSNCRRIRITSDGMIKTCLLRNDNLVRYEGKESMIKAMGGVSYDRYN